MTYSEKLNFIELYSREQKKIFLFIISMVHRHTDAEDIMQQTASEMWRMFDRFEEGTNFAAWGMAIARYKILDYRKQQNKKRLFLSNEVYDNVLKELKTLESNSDQRINALKGCLKKLKQSDHQLLSLHYEDGFSYKQIAEKFDLSKSGIYKVMARIHVQLQKCVRRTLLVWEASG